MPVDTTLRMAQMDHNQALQLQAAVKYVLGELSQVQRDEYEDHYFDCAECAVDIKALATFADTTREVLRHERATQIGKGLAVQSAPLAVEAVQVAAPQGLPVFSLLGSNRRGGARPVFHARAGESFALKVDIPDTDSFASSSYVLRLDDGSGTARVLSTVSRDEARNTVFVEVPAGFPAGNAQLVVLATPPPGAGARTAREITSIPFVVAIESDIEHHP